MISAKVRGRMKKNKKHPLARATASDTHCCDVVPNPWQDILVDAKNRAVKSTKNRMSKGLDKYFAPYPKQPATPLYALINTLKKALCVQ